jgi:hypothetical protein
LLEQLLSVPVVEVYSAELPTLFTAFDENGNGTITWREWLAGVGLLILPPALDANVMALWGFISAKAPGGHVALNTLTSDTQLKCYVAHYRHREQEFYTMVDLFVPAASRFVDGFIGLGIEAYDYRALVYSNRSLLQMFAALAPKKSNRTEHTDGKASEAF